MIKTLINVGIEGAHLHIINAIYKKYLQPISYSIGKN